MQTVRIVRDLSTDEGTFGTLSTAGFTCHTGELPYKNNARKVSCIPMGAFAARWTTYHPHIGPCYEIFNVPGRSAILIHSGNFCGDVSLGYRSDFLGCIGLGRSLGELSEQKALLQSRDAVASFVAIMKREDFLLDIS